MQNPFNPFSPLPKDIQSLAADRTVLVEKLYSRLCCDSHASFAIAAGGMGVGKSTLLCGPLASRLREEGWYPIVLVASSGLTAEELLLQTAEALGVGVPNVLRRLGLDRPEFGGQTAGSVSDSSGVTVIQAQLEGWPRSRNLQWSSSRTAAALQQLAQLAKARVVVLLDQAEHLFLGAEAEKAILLLEALVRTASSPLRRVGAVVAIREEFLHHVLVLAGPFPSVTSGIVPIGGLQPKDAAKFISSALSLYGASFSKRLTETIVGRLCDVRGTVWPVALHACCKPLADLSKTQGKTVSVQHLNALGDLSGIVGQVVAGAVKKADPPFADDTIYGLYVLSGLCQHEGLVRFERLAQSLPAFPLDDVARITRLLKTLRLVEEPRPGQLRLAHDSLAAAVFGLRHGTGSDERVRALDLAVAEWGANDKLLRPEEAVGFIRNDSRGLPTPHLVVLAASLFRGRLRLDDDWLSLMLKVLSGTDGKQVVRLVVEHGTRHGRAPALMPEEVFVLAAFGAYGGLATAMAGIVAAASGPGASWAEAEYGDAIRLSRPDSLGKWLYDSETSTIPPSVLRCIVRTLLLETSISVEAAVLSRLWESAAAINKPDILALTASRFPDCGGEMALECAQSDADYLRAAAADVVASLGPDIADAIITYCLADNIPAVRRRGVFAVGSRGESAHIERLLHLLAQDPSPLVREACLEVLAHLPTSKHCVEAVKYALKDPFDFVRESAAYALAHFLAPAEAAEAVAQCSWDSSPKVREAALRLTAAAQSLPEYTTALRDLRSETTSLRVAAAEALVYAVSDDIDVALDQVLLTQNTDSDTLLATIRTAGQRRAKLCVPSIIALLGSPDVAVVCEAIIALTLIGGEDVVPHIEACAFHVSVDVRERTVYALAELGGKQSIAILSGCLSDPRDEIRVRAIYALARLGAVDATPRVKLVSQFSSQAQTAVEYFLKQISGRTRPRYEGGIKWD